MKRHKKILFITLLIILFSGLSIFVARKNDTKENFEYDKICISEEDYQTLEKKKTENLIDFEDELYEYLIDVNGPYHFYSTKPKVYVLGTETSIQVVDDCGFMAYKKNICEWKKGELYTFQRDKDELHEIVLFSDWINGNKVN